jgi:hypothetical protein
MPTGQKNRAKNPVFRKNPGQQWATGHQCQQVRYLDKSMLSTLPLAIVNRRLGVRFPSPAPYKNLSCDILLSQDFCCPKSVDNWATRATEGWKLLQKLI